MRSARRPAPRQIRPEDSIKLASGYLLVALALVGCGTAPKKEPAKSQPSTPNSTKEDSRRVIESGRVTLEALDPKGRITWKLIGESSRSGLSESGDNEFYVQKSSGDLYKNGKVASRFSSTEAKAVTVTRKLVLDGNVKVTSLTQKVTLKADKITWMEDKGLFAAIGNVSVDSPDWKMENLPEVWATPELDKFGTPKNFR